MADIITVTDNALKRVKHLIQLREKPPFGIKVGVKTKGCAGLAYTVDYAEDYDTKDELIDKEGIKIIIDHKAVLFLIGSQMDFIQNSLGESEFIFSNPNAKNTCGCGESFNV